MVTTNTSVMAHVQPVLALADMNGRLAEIETRLTRFPVFCKPVCVQDFLDARRTPWCITIFSTGIFHACSIAVPDFIRN